MTVIGGHRLKEGRSPPFQYMRMRRVRGMYGHAKPNLDSHSTLRVQIGLSRAVQR